MRGAKRSATGMKDAMLAKHAFSTALKNTALLSMAHEVGFSIYFAKLEVQKMSKADVLVRLQEIVEDVYGAAPDFGYDAESVGFDELGDSLEKASFMSEIENKFNVSVDSLEYDEARTIGDIVKLLTDAEAR